MCACSGKVFCSCRGNRTFRGGKWRYVGAPTAYKLEVGVTDFSLSANEIYLLHTGMPINNLSMCSSCPNALIEHLRF